MSLYTELLFQQGYLTQAALVQDDAPSPQPRAEAPPRGRPRLLRAVGAAVLAPEEDEGGLAAQGCA